MEIFKKAKLCDYNGDMSQQWYVYYSFRHPETNKFVRFKKAITVKFKTKRERYKKASEICDYINSKLVVGWNPYGEELKGFTNIVEALENILEVKGASLRKRSKFTYRNVIKTFSEFLRLKKYEKSSVSDISMNHAQEFLDWAMLEKKVSNRTHNNYLRNMRTFFNELVLRNYCLSNPFAKIKKLQQEESDLLCFSKEELLILQKHLKDYNYSIYFITQLIFNCFMRPAEIVRLRISDFNLSKQELIIRGTQSKNKNRSIVVLPNHMISQLLEQFKEYPTNYYAFSRDFKPGEFEIAPTRIAEAWRKFANLHNINKDIYHLKHTGVGFSIENGINVRDLQLQLRHHSLEMTQVYLDKFNNKASDKIKNQLAVF